jgi:hypothetical protein
LHQLEQKNTTYNSLDFVKNLVGELLGPGAGSFGQLAILSTYNFVHLPFGHFTIGPVDLSFCLLISCFESLPFRVPTCDFVNLPLGHCALSLICLFVNLLFYQLVI